MNRNFNHEDYMPRKREPLFADIRIYEAPHGFDVTVNSNCEYIHRGPALQLINFIRQRCDDWEKACKIRFDKLNSSDQ